MEVIEMRVADLLADPANVREHSEANLQAIEASLRRFGQQSPIVVDSNGIVRKGNGTLTVAARLGWETIKGTETQLQGSEATAYAIADNRTAELATWNDEALAAQLQALADESADLLAACAFTDEELQALTDQFVVSEADLPSLPDGERFEYVKMTFTLHTSQAKVVEAAITEAIAAGFPESEPNTNRNGNALAVMAREFITEPEGLQTLRKIVAAYFSDDRGDNLTLSPADVAVIESAANRWRQT